MKQRSPSEVEGALNRYREVLERYAGTLDLMSPAGLQRLDEHLRDALVYADIVAGLSPAPARLLDVGSGAGLPGLAIAAALPELAVELVERRRKRAAFLAMAVGAMEAPSTIVRGGDVRQSEGPRVDVVTAQAVGSLASVHALTRHRHAPTVHILSRKGPGWRDEVAEVEAAVGAVQVVAEVPLAHRGTLVAVRMAGGTRCRSSE